MSLDKKFKKGGNKNGAKEMSGALGEGTDYSNVQESSFDRPEKALADNLPKKSFLPCTPKVPPRNVPGKSNCFVLSYFSPLCFLEEI